MFVPIYSHPQKVKLSSCAFKKIHFDLSPYKKLERYRITIISHCTSIFKYLNNHSNLISALDTFAVVCAYPLCATTFCFPFILMVFTPLVFWLFVCSNFLKVFNYIIPTIYSSLYPTHKC